MSFSGVLRTIRSSQSGNVFFALFGAVALVGVVGATSMQVMRGPVRSMSEVTKRTVAENNMIASSKLALLAATSQANDGDCDADTFVEPIPFEDAGASPKPTGGGYLPATIGAAINDPWDTRYGYCVWNSGALTSGNGCAANFLTGSADQTGYAIAIISAGPDRTFNTTCSAYPSATALNKTPGSDDVVLGYTYAEAEANSGGLWNLKDADTAKIAKNLEVTNNAGDQVAFALDAETGMGDFIGLTTGGITAKGTNPLSITGGLKLDDDFVETGACTAAENDAFAFDTTGDKLIRCNGANWVAAGGSDNLGNHIATQNIRLASYWLSGDGGNEGVQVAADGAVSTSGALTTGATLAVGTNATVGGTLGVTGATTLSTVNTSGLGTLNSLSVTNAAAVGGTLNVTGGTSLTSLATSGVATLNSLAVTNAATIGTTLGVTGATTLSTVNTSGLGTLHSLAVTNNASIGGELDLTGGKIVNLLDPTLAQDAASKAYVDARVAAGTGFVEADPQVATLNATKWCVANAGGTAIECTENTPAGAADNLGNHTATQALAMGTFKITNMADPTTAQDAATKAYVDNVVLSGSPSTFRAHRNGTNQTVTTSTSTVITFVTEAFDPGNEFNPATGRYTPTVAGKYVVVGSVRCTDATAQCQAAILKNGLSTGFRSFTKGTGDIIAHVAGIIEVNGAGDYLELIGYNGGGVTISGTADSTYFAGALLGGSGGGSGDNLGDHTATQALAMGGYAINNSGNINVGASGTTYELQLHDAGTNRVDMQISNSTTGATATDGFVVSMTDNDVSLSNRENGYMGFNINSTERMRLTTNGDLEQYKHLLLRDGNGANSKIAGLLSWDDVLYFRRHNTAGTYEANVANIDLVTGTLTATAFVGDGSGLTGLPSGADNLGNHIATTTLRSDTNNTDDLGTTAIRWKEGWFSHNLNARALLLEGGFIQLNSDGDADVGLITEAGLDGIGLVGNATRIATPDLYVTDAGDVGIGDNTPSSKLQVNGTVTATAFAGSGASLTGIVSAGITDETITAADIATGAVDSTEIAGGAVDLAHLSATGTKSATTFLRGDNTWAAPTVDTPTRTTNNYTTAGTATWTKPAGAELVFVECWGGGGAGGKSSGVGCARGGAGGGYGAAWFLASDLTNTVTVTIAGAVTGRTTTGAGTAGEDSRFGSFLIANGGAGGAGVASGSCPSSQPAAPAGGTVTFHATDAFNKFREHGGNGGVSWYTGSVWGCTVGESKTIAGAGGGGTTWAGGGANCQGGDSLDGGDGGNAVNAGAGGDGTNFGGGGGASVNSAGASGDGKQGKCSVVTIKR